MLPRFLRNILEIEPRRPPDPFEAFGFMLRGMITTCPVCNLNLDNHAWTVFAEAGNEDDTRRLFELLEEQSWPELKAIQSFVGSKNASIAQAIECPRGKGERGECNLLPSEQWASLKEALPTLAWYPF